MPYIGHSPTQAGTFYIIDALTMGSGTGYNMQVGGVDVTPNVDNLLITLDGVIQHPVSSYTVSGSTLTFASGPGTGVEFFGIIMGQSASFGQGSIGADQLKVTGDGTSGQVLVSDGDGTFTWTTDTENYLPLAGGALTGAVTTNSTFDGVDIATRDAILSSTTTTAGAALPKAGGTMSGNIAMGGGDISGGGTITGTFVGGITGNVTGNASGTALTVTQAAQSAITSVGTLTGLTTSGNIIVSGSSARHIQFKDSSELEGSITFDETADGFIFKVGGTGGSLTDAMKIDTAGKTLIKDNLVVGTTTVTGSDYQFSQNLIVKGSTPALILDETDAEGFITMYANAGEQYLMYDHAGSFNIKHATSTGGSNGTDVLTLSGSGNATFAGTASIKYGLTIDPSGTNSRLLQITNTETGNFNEMVDVLAPNASNDIHTAGIYFGRARSTDELGHITFIPSASSSQSQIALGIWSRNDLLKLRGDGQATFAGQILGSASGVSYSFTGDTDTGIQSGGTNTLQITTAGAKALDFDANQYASFTGNVTFGGQKTQHYSGWETQTIAFGSAITGWSSNNTGARISVPLHATAGQAHGSFQFYTNKGDTEVYALEIHQDGTLKSNLTGAWNMIDTRESGTDKGHILLVNGSTNVGQIISASSSCAFTSLSDYRMKENEVAISDGITRLKQLKPYSFNFKIEPDKTYDGFFAHEVSSIVPEAVIGTKDGVDGDGEIVAQGIDQSKLVPLLVSALQEAIDRIEALENA
jgi:hypothetical protein